ncbi:MAG TPA: PAS domain S-box protein, partial [Spirochaetota bacterium]|nr:PAS domain S-box protein [Spirochaetota bacterium]
KLFSKTKIKDIKGFNYFQYEKIRKNIEYNLVEIGNTNPHRWERIYNDLKDIKLVKREFNKDRVIFNEKKWIFDKNKFNFNILIFIILISCLVLIILLLLVRNFSMVHKHNLNKIIESEKRYKDLVNNMLEGVWIIGLDYKTKFVNTRLEKILGFNEKELDKITILDLITETNKERLNIFFNKVSQGENIEFEIDLLGKENNTITVLIESTPVYDEDKNINGILNNIMDITERLKFESNLIISETKFKTLFELLPVGVVILDKNNNIVDMNSMCLKILGWPRERFLKNDLPTYKYFSSNGHEYLTLKDDFPFVVAMSKQESIENVEIKIVKDDGLITWIKIDVAPINIADISTVIVITDITNKKIDEINLKNAYDERSIMINEIHHRVKNNLNSIVAILSLQKFSDENKELKNVIK